MTSSQRQTAQQYANQIIQYGRQSGYSQADIALAVRVAFIESTLGNRMSKDGQNATGLYQYQTGNWNDRHSDMNRGITGDQIKAFYQDIERYTKRYNDLKEKGDSRIDGVSRDEYVYIKHHDGSNATKFDSSSDGYNIYHDSFDKENREGLSIDDLINNYNQPPETPDTGHDPNVEVQILPADPIVINIDGKGIGVVSYKGESIAMFDFDGDGIANYTSWVAEGSGLLVLDKNTDGKINSGNELFGDDTVLSNNATAVNGYEALAELDSNADGKIDAQDKEFKNLKVWLDADGDGETDAGELHSLEELEIASLDLNYKDVNKNLSNGNSITQISSFTKTDGTTGEMGDVNLSYNDSITQYRDTIQLTAEQSARPNFIGHGNLRDLNQAAATSNELAGILDQYSATSTKAGQIALLDNLIMAWAKTSPYYNAAHSVSIAAAKYIEVASSDTKMTRAQFNALQQKAVAFAETLHISQDSLDKVRAISGKFCVLGELLGKQTSTLYLSSAEELDNIINNIENTYKDFSKAFYTSLAMQTRLQNYFEKAVFVQGGDGQYHWDFIGAQEAFNKVWTTDQAKAFVDLGEFIQIFNWDGGQALFTEWLAIAQDQGVADAYLALLGEGGFLLDYQKLDAAGTLKGTAKNDILQGSDADDRLEAGDGDDVINAADGNDRIYGGNGSDTITGGRGNDAIYDGNGDDRVDAGDGNDYIEGGQGSDTYIFKGDFGKDAGGNYCRSCAGDTASFCPGTARRRMWRCSINFDEAPRMGRFFMAWTARQRRNNPMAATDATRAR